jgi:hypothetical protein
MTEEKVKNSLKVIGAVIKVQEELKAIERTTDNTFFKAKYAPLEEVMKHLQPLLTKNDLALMHIAETASTEEEVVETKEKGGETITKRWKLWNVTTTTMLIHSSGEYVEMTLTIPIFKPDAQSVGQVITYSRRYSILSLLNVITIGEDLDGFYGETPHGDNPPAAKPEKTTKAPEPSVTEKFQSYNFEKPEIEIFKKAGLLTQTMMVKERENHESNKDMVAAMLAKIGNK